jgi:hypothetical protein
MRRVVGNTCCVVEVTAAATGLNYRLGATKPLANCAGSKMFAGAEASFVASEKNLINFAGWADF